MRAPSVLLDARRLATRRDAARGPLAPLVASLAADLAPLVGAALFVPPEKARLTRLGGRCPVDGTLLAFDPFSPHRHHCPACGREYADDEHYRWWIMWYQLWLAERAVHGATLGALTGDARFTSVAHAILDAYADRYLTYPNQDNVLGPTRPFFSTYLESIWLLQLCVALDLLEASGDERSRGQRVRERIIEPSRALIARYDEGGSNRQVWNAAALAAASRVLGDDAAAEHAILGPTGVASHLTNGLLADGTWYEGENYHQFAHRGLWYGVVIAERAGIALPATLRDRFHDGFVAPFLTALPDLTLPARRDSQWAISLRQWRYAEACELGLARRDDPRLGGALAALYDVDVALPRRDTGRSRSAAESERNEPPSALARADLGWRSLLFARPELAHADRWAPASVLLPAQGIAVFRRRAGAVAAALDYGTSGGGHGHPDRLNILLAEGARRWLDDMGTGSYVERKLHWYRSTLAHNAPLVDGRSQRRVDGELLAYEERGDWGWVRARAAIAPHVDAARSLVVAPDYVVDHLEWRADREVTLDLPMHAALTVGGDVAWTPASIAGAGGLEDGFDFLSDVEAAMLDAGVVLTTRAPSTAAIVAHGLPNEDVSEARLDGWLVADVPLTVYRATAPSSPGRPPALFVFVRATGSAGTITTVWSTSAAVTRVETRDGAIHVHAPRGVEAHALEDGRWTVSRVGTSAPTLRLEGVVPRSAPSAARPVAPRDDAPSGVTLPSDGTAVTFTLGEDHYRPSEVEWQHAGAPTATVVLRIEHDALVVRVDVVTPHLSVVPAGTDNPLDNERAEVNGDGVQLYVLPAGASASDETAAWLIVPELGASGARIIALTPSATSLPLHASAAPTALGYSLTASLPLDAVVARDATDRSFGFDLIVNETTPERERRRGQLVLSGRRGEFVYLQGDRQRADRFYRVRLAALDESPAEPMA